MEKKFTQGEWTVDYNDGYNVRVVANGTQEVADCGMRNNQNVYDAQLIAAAPELLEALEELLQLYSTDEGCKSLPEYIKAQKAINKAYGKE